METANLLHFRPDLELQSAKKTSSPGKTSGNRNLSSTDSKQKRRAKPYLGVDNTQSNANLHLNHSKLNKLNNNLDKGRLETMKSNRVNSKIDKGRQKKEEVKDCKMVEEILDARNEDYLPTRKPNIDFSGHERCFELSFNLNDGADEIDEHDSNSRNKEKLRNDLIKNKDKVTLMTNPKPFRVEQLDVSRKFNKLPCPTSDSVFRYQSIEGNLYGKNCIAQLVQSNECSSVNFGKEILSAGQISQTNSTKGSKQKGSHHQTLNQIPTPLNGLNIPHYVQQASKEYISIPKDEFSLGNSKKSEKSDQSVLWNTAVGPCDPNIWNETVVSSKNHSFDFGVLNPLFDENVPFNVLSGHKIHHDMTSKQGTSSKSKGKPVTGFGEIYQNIMFESANSKCYKNSDFLLNGISKLSNRIEEKQYHRSDESASKVRRKRTYMKSHKEPNSTSVSELSVLSIPQNLPQELSQPAPYELSSTIIQNYNAKEGDFILNKPNRKPKIPLDDKQKRGINSIENTNGTSNDITKPSLYQPSDSSRESDCDLNSAYLIKPISSKNQSLKQLKIDNSCNFPDRRVSLPNISSVKPDNFDRDEYIQYKKVLKECDLTIPKCLRWNCLDPCDKSLCINQVKQGKDIVELELSYQQLSKNAQNQVPTKLVLTERRSSDSNLVCSPKHYLSNQISVNKKISSFGIEKYSNKTVYNSFPREKEVIIDAEQSDRGTKSTEVSVSHFARSDSSDDSVSSVRSRSLLERRVGSPAHINKLKLNITPPKPKQQKKIRKTPRVHRRLNNRSPDQHVSNQCLQIDHNCSVEDDTLMDIPTTIQKSVISEQAENVLSTNPITFFANSPQKSLTPYPTILLPNTVQSNYITQRLPDLTSVQKTNLASRSRKRKSTLSKKQSRDGSSRRHLEDVTVFENPASMKDFSPPRQSEVLSDNMAYPKLDENNGPLDEYNMQYNFLASTPLQFANSEIPYHHLSSAPSSAFPTPDTEISSTADMSVAINSKERISLEIDQQLLSPDPSALGSHFISKMAPKPYEALQLVR